MDNTVLIALIAFISSSITIILSMLLKICYSSKCISTSLCYGCLEVKRDIEHEQNINNLELNNIKLPALNNNV
jgi:hypothetical protein